MNDAPFAELLDTIVDNRGRTAPTATSGIPLIATNCIKDDHLFPVKQKVRFVDDETYNTWFRGHPEPGDILFVCKGSPGRTAVVADPVDFVIAQDMVAVRADPLKIYPKFLFAALRSPGVRQQIDSMHVGSLIPHFKKGDFDKLRIPMPDRKTQETIGDFYFELSEKIESNRRAIDLLSDLFSMHFKQAVANPDSRSVPLGEIIEIIKGRSYNSSELDDSPTALVTLKNIDRNGGYKGDGLKPYTGPYKPQQVVAPGEIVIAQTDLTQGAEIVGRGVRVPQSRAYETLVASLDLAIIRPLEALPMEYLLGLVSSEDFRQHCRSRVTGTTVLHLAKDAIPTWLAPIIPEAKQTEFALIARALLLRSDSLTAEIDRLSALRDALLPELLAGRIRASTERETAS